MHARSIIEMEASLEKHREVMRLWGIGEPVDAVAAHVGFSAWWTESILRANGVELPLMARLDRAGWPRPARRIPDDVLLGKIRAAALAVGEPLTIKAYVNWARSSGIPEGKNTILQRFGGRWTEACALAGVKPGRPGGWPTR